MNKKVLLIGGVVVACVFMVFGIGVVVHYIRIELERKEIARLATLVESPFIYSFNVDGILSEAGSMYTSTSPYWWLNSGGLLYIGSGTGRTVQGELSQSNLWRKLYAQSNAEDSDDGYHPQNIFRLVTRSTWNNFQQEVYVRIKKINKSSSPNRNESNGVFLFNRYRDGDNLYYTGIRVDGHAVIKKKVEGIYFTMDEQPLFAGEKYNGNSNANLLPVEEWIGLRSEIVDIGPAHVRIRLYVDVGKKGEWKLVSEVIDDNRSYGGESIVGKHHAGIRSDFMDIELSEYRIEEIEI